VNLADIELNVAELDLSKGFDLIYDLLLAYGLPKSGVTLLRKGSRDLSGNANEHLWKNRVFYRFVEDAESDLHSLIDVAHKDEKVTRAHPRFLIVRDAERLLAVDTGTETTLDIPLIDLPIHSAFFMPWAGIEKTQLESLNYADVKAAEKMARLYDEIAKHNATEDEQDVRNLNIFFSRLLFCFFAEDTMVFEEGSFTDSIASLTQADGSDTAAFLDQLFEVLDTEPSQRASIPSHFRGFGYVNGRLFAQRAPSPTFSAKARRIVLESGTLDWSQINPDIFGSMIQAVVQPGQREGLGMHYTSVENIMKVIRPLFLDDLHGRFDKADTVRKLERLLARICEIKVFDPACGSGNFLVIAYKELRKLEHRILQRIEDLDPNRAGLFKLSGIKLDHFYGIEIDYFAHEIAILSLWLAKHQMNVEFNELFGVEIELIPLKDTGNITCGNAARLDWTATCPPDENTFVCGNPPYQYGTKRSPEQSEDVVRALEDPSTNKYLDYVAIWFYKGAKYATMSGSTVGFVSTNSICQGKQVALLWPRILSLGVEISFARTSFRWSNNAKGNAGVTCIVVGMSVSPPKLRRLFSDDGERAVAHINPYLLPTSNDTTVSEAVDPISPRPRMFFGSMPRDGGHLVLSPTERASLLSTSPEAGVFVKPYVGGSEFIKGTERFCLWIEDQDLPAARRIPEIMSRLEHVASFRRQSKAKSTQALAKQPHRFAQISYKSTSAIAIPAVSSERRDYIPMGFLDAGTVVSNKVYVVYDASAWLFGLLQSQMHMAWVRTIGGRMKTDYSYANSLVYNTFPFPALGSDSEANLTDRALRVLEAREQFPDRTLAELYDPQKMPRLVRDSHSALDDTVDALYQTAPFSSDAKRMDLLLSMYSALTKKEAVHSDA
jgi:hypothetical protein